MLKLFIHITLQGIADWLNRCSVWFIETSVKLLPTNIQRRCREEWLADLETLRNPLQKLVFSVDTIRAVRKINSELANRTPNDSLNNYKESLLVTSSLNLNDYKRAIADSYDRRSLNYDEGEWRKQVCDNLLNYSLVGEEQHILDIGTGTGRLAIAAANIVGDRGLAIGVDISSEMLTIARNKVDNMGVSNVKFQLADAENLDYPRGSFDYILCANTFPWMSSKEAVLRSWHHFLKPDGRIAIHTPADTAYVGAVVLRQVLATHGITVEPSNRIGSIEQCKKLFILAGFQDIEIKQEQYGSYTNFESAYLTWNSVIENPSNLSLKVSKEISKLTSAQLAGLQSEFKAALIAKQTKEGIWDDLTTLYILGRKVGLER